MSTNPRETQFQGFAKLLAEELLQGVWIDAIDSHWREIWHETVARRAYDFVEHVIQSRLQGIELLMRLDREWVAEQVQSIPDLTQWPED